MGGEAYRAAGITGKGQVCGIADSGLNDLSCFFYDGPSSLSPSSPGSHTSAYRGVLTNRSGLIEPLRRKVIQYTAYADMTDELGETAMQCAALQRNIMSYYTIAQYVMPCRASYTLQVYFSLHLNYFKPITHSALTAIHLSLSSFFHAQTYPHHPFPLLLFSSSILLILSL